MSGVACLGEKAEVGQSISLDKLNLFPDPLHIGVLSNGGMNKHEKKEDQVEGYE
jgi:hypothetical protein